MQCILEVVNKDYFQPHFKVSNISAEYGSEYFPLRDSQSFHYWVDQIWKCKTEVRQYNMIVAYSNLENNILLVKHIKH